MKLQQYFEVQGELLRLETSRKENSEALRQVKYDMRCCEEALWNYEGGIRSFLDKLSGKREEKLEALGREVRKAEAGLDALRREKTGLEAREAELKRLLAALPSSEELRKGNEMAWASLEAAFCAEALQPLLEENRKALLDYRSLIQGNHPEILSPYQQQEICVEPNLRAEKCLPYLQRLKEAREILGNPLEPGSYYDSPAAFLVAPAAIHNRRDRINQALAQVEALQKKLKE